MPGFLLQSRREQLRIFGKVLEKQFEVKKTGYIVFSAGDAKELKILNRTITVDVLTRSLLKMLWMP